LSSSIAVNGAAAALFETLGPVPRYIALSIWPTAKDRAQTAPADMTHQAFGYAREPRSLAGPLATRRAQHEGWSTPQPTEGDGRKEGSQSKD
jgi:hypothetical protein